MGLIEMLGKVNQMGMPKGMLVLLNTSIITKPGKYELSSPFTVDTARSIVHCYLHDWNVGCGDGIESAIGHQATADILTELLGTKIEMNRIEFQHQVNQFALVFKLRSRVPEGVILTRKEIDELGYDFYLLERVV